MKNLLAFWNKLDWKRKTGLIGVTAAIAAFLFVFIIWLSVALGLSGPLPSKSEIKNISQPVASELYASNDVFIGKYFVENRSYLAKEDLNDFYKNALIATEDHRFYDHSGVDYRSLFRVFFKSILLQRDASGGGSTITQQLVKNIYKRKPYFICSTLVNKFREMRLAKRFEKVYTKEEILWLYSNTVSFGERAFGLATASERFFSKKPKDLLIEEAAALVGLLKATSYYNPRRFPERAKNRRNVVLSQMRKHAFISDKAYKQLSSLPLKLAYKAKDENQDFAGYFKAYVKKEFEDISEDLRKEDGSTYDLSYDGLKVYTSLDYEMQIAGEAIVAKHMEKLQKLFEESWRGKSMYGKSNRILDEYILKHPVYKQLKEKVPSKQLIKQFNTEEERKLWSWKEGEAEKLTRIDSIKHYLKLLHNASLAVDSRSGAIKLWIGGNDFQYFPFDNVSAARQVGSLFKPFVYLTALENDKDVCDYFKNELRTYSEYDDWTPENSDGEYGGYLSMKAALTNSVNTISVQLMFENGFDKVIATAKEMGITSPLNPVPSLVLGTSDISLFEMVQAYRGFSNPSSRNDIFAITKIEDSKGNLIWQREIMEAEDERFNADKIDELNKIMQYVTLEGTAKRLYQQFDIPFLVKGKTGTTQNQSDGWFIGYNEDLVIGSWVGTQDRRMHFPSLGTGSGGRTALPIVGALFEYAGSRGMIQNKYEEAPYFECPDFLSEEQYAFYQKDKSIFEDEEELEDPAQQYGGWLKKIFKRKKNKSRLSLNDQYEQKQIESEINRLKKERDQRMKAYEAEMRLWEEKLKRLQNQNSPAQGQ